MAYSTQSSTVVSVTNFGVKLDGVTDNRGPLQNAVNSLYSNGGGTLHFPAGNCYWSGTIDVTGRNIKWVGEGDSVLVAAPNEAAKKINISGAQNVDFSNLLINGGRTGGTTHTSNQYGFISVTDSSNISVTNCTLYETLNSLIYLGGGTRFVNVSNNYFSGHFCAIYSYVNPGESGSEAFVIQGNRFGWSWCTGDVGESACIKLQTSPSQTYQSRGHVISNNVIDSPMQMGVELWSRGRNNVVANNTIENTCFGISLDNQDGASVTANTVRNVTYAGIELASVCRRCVILGNTVDGYVSTDTGNLDRRTIYGIVLSNTSCEDNIFSSNTVLGTAGCGMYVQNAQNTTISSSILRDNSTNLYIHSASMLKCHDTLFDTGAFQTNYQVFFDASSVSISGFHFSDNKFRGATNQQSIFYYNNGTSNGVFDVCFENNVTDGTTRGGYDIFIGGQLTPSNYVYRDNFGPSTPTAANSILDSSDTPTPFQPSDIYSAYTYYDTQSWTVPASGVTGDAAWLCIWSGGGGADNVVRVRCYNSAINEISGNWGSHVYEATASMSPYEGSYLADSLTVNPGVLYNGDIFSEIHTQKHDTSIINNSVWVKVRSLSSGWSGQQLSFAFSNENLLTGVYAVHSTPAWKNGTKGLVLSEANSLYAKYSDGLSIGSDGTARIYCPSSGRINAETPNGWFFSGGNVGIGTESPNASLDIWKYYSAGTDSLRFSYNDGTAYWMGIQPYVVGAGNVGYKFRTNNGSVTTEALAIAGNGKIGIGTTTPQFSLHVSGSLGLSGIATSTTASVGSATLPANPVGFVTINITGGNFKIPYYNL